jgi:predicted small metal-binding protein
MVKEVVCANSGYDCDFVIRSENEAELVEFVQEHARETHDTEMSAEDVRGAMQSV